MRSTENVPSEAVSEAGDTEREDPPVVSPPPSTAVSEAGDVSSPVQFLMQESWTVMMMTAMTAVRGLTSTPTRIMTATARL